MVLGGQEDHQIGKRYTARDDEHGEQDRRRETVSDLVQHGSEGSLLLKPTR